MDASDSAYDRLLLDHVFQNHRNQIKAALEWHDGDVWDVYKQAIAVREREKVPTVGPAVDRRSVNHTLVAYNMNDRCKSYESDGRESLPMEAAAEAVFEHCRIEARRLADWMQQEGL